MVQDTHVLTCSAWPNWEPNCSKCSRRIKPSESSSHTSNTSLSFLTSVSRCPGSGIKSSSISLLLYSSVGCFSSMRLACGTMLFGNSSVCARVTQELVSCILHAREEGVMLMDREAGCTQVQQCTEVHIFFTSHSVFDHFFFLQNK